MATRTRRCRILAIEVRSHKIGYAVFEGRKTLLDWGIRWFARGNKSDLSRKLTSLLQMSRPRLIVVSGINESDHRNGHLLRFPTREIRKQAALRSIPMKTLSKKYLRNHFKRRGRWNKYEVAQAIARRFPELAWHIPRKRKAWDSESPNQVVFDAVALALHYFSIFAARKLDNVNTTTKRALWSAPNDE